MSTHSTPPIVCVLVGGGFLVCGGGGGGGGGGAAVGDAGELPHVPLHVHTIQRFHIKQSVWFRFYGCVERLVGTELLLSYLQEESRERPPLRSLSEESWLKKWLVLDLGLQVPKVGKTQESIDVKNVSKHPDKGIVYYDSRISSSKRADSHFTQNLWKVYFSARERSYLLPDVPSSQNEWAFPHSTSGKIHYSHPSPFPSGLGGSIFFFASLAMWHLLLLWKQDISLKRLNFE